MKNLKKLFFSLFTIVFFLITFLHANTYNVNLIQGGTAENANDINEWNLASTSSGIMKIANYSTGWAGTAPSNAGSNFFYATGGDTTTLRQNIDVGTLSSDIDTGNINYDFRAYLGGFGDQDTIRVHVAFKDSSNTTLTTYDTGNFTSDSVMTAFNNSAFIPIGTREITVSLIIIRNSGTDADGYADNISLILSPPNTPPTANAGVDQIINLGDPVTLDGSTSNDSDGNIVSYAWYEGVADKGNSSNITLNNLTAGTHTFTLTVTDNYGDSSSDTVIVDVNTAPVADAGVNQTITLGDTLILDGTGSTDDTGIVTYAWTESTIPLTLSGDKPTANITTAGTYTFTLIVTDALGLHSSDTVKITIQDTNATLVVEDMNFSILKNTSVSFELNASNSNNTTIVSYPIFNGPLHGSLSGPESNMTYTPDLDFTGIDSFTYKAFDGTVYSNEGTVTINIFPPATAVHDDFNTTYITLLNGNVLTNDLGLNIDLIDFNTTANGSLNIGSDGTFTYKPNELFDGNDTFTYTIEDDFNLTSTTTVTILVFPPRADLSIVKSAPAQTDTGLALDYTLSISSAVGEAYIPAQNVRVTDHLPSGVTYTGVTAPSGWTCAHISGAVTCDTSSSLAPGYSGDIIIHALAPDILGDSVNVAEVSSDTIDPDLSNNTSSATTNITGLDVDLSISKSVSSPTVLPTNSFSYTIVVQNSGSASSTGVTVTDTLPPSLGFISIDGNGDWSCSQGSSINCSYIANGGVFAAGASSSSIVITVRAPSVESNITNTANVLSNNLELNTANNSDSADVNITQGIIPPAAQVPLTKYLQYNFYGDMTLLGNANVNWDGVNVSAAPNTTFPPSYNDSAQMDYVDTDSVQSTFNSSSSTLSLGGDYDIIWAGLYWEGHLCSSDAAGTSTNTGGRCDWSNSSFTNYNQALPNIGTVQLKTPNRSNYITVNANRVNTVGNANLNISYTAFADITNLLASNEVGTYTLANIVLTEGIIRGGGNYGGWTMLVLYEDENQTLQYKNISVFNGFQAITADNIPLTITGFTTPKSATTINASIAFFAADGDPINGGSARMRVGNSTTFTPIGDTLNPTTNLFNSTMTQLGNNINSAIPTYGVDADRIDVSTFMVNDQSNTAFFFDVDSGIAVPNANPARNYVDHYTLSMFAFATDLTTPVIDNLDKKAVIINKNGDRRASDSNRPIYPGESLEYTITFTNSGDEIAEEVTIFDDFDLDGLTRVLDVSHFDKTKLILSTGLDTSNPISNPDCDYDLADRRVYCNLDSVGINGINDSYTMQFVVTLKDTLNPSDFNTSAVNTAYAKYRNPNGNTYVELYTTPITNEPVGGKSNSLNAGILTPYTRGDDKFISIDAINAGYNYTGPQKDRNITTKIVNKPFDIKLIHRNKVDEYSPYVTTKNTLPMAVIVTLVNGYTVMPPINNPKISYFHNGVYELPISGLNLTRAHSNDKLKMAYLDWETILSWVPSTSPCRLNPIFSTNLNGLPACFNNYNYVKEIFSSDTHSLPAVANCYGRGATPNSTPPCNALAYRTGGEPVGIITPSYYDHNFGCYQCITQAFSGFRKDSTDNFAARPDHFTFSSNDAAFPDLLRSGQEYNLSLTALDGSTNNPQATLGYDTLGNKLRTGTTEYNPSNNSAVTALLEGDANMTASGAIIKDGISVDANGDIIDSVGFTFDNVGEVRVNIVDPSWANVDLKDTPLECNATLLSQYGKPMEASLSICGGVDVTFIPHHFILTSELENHRNGRFTYMHTNNYAPNKPHMAAHVNLAIQAENKQGDITTNFKENAYENPITVDLNITDWNTTLKNLKNLENPRLDINRNKKAITNMLLGFGTKGYNDGTYTIETNSSTPYTEQLMFNYNRAENAPKNPFEITGSEVNSTVISTYTTTKGAPDGTALIKGTDVADGNATFYYARVRPAKDFYPNISAAQQNTPVLIDVYCNISADLNYTRCNRAEIGIDTTIGYFIGNDYKWWLALKHDQSLNDGNVTLKVTGTGGLNKTKVIILTANNAEDDNITVTPNTVNRPITVRIDLDTTNQTDTNTWIYDPFGIAAPPPFEEIEFVGNSNWTGQGETGNVVGSSSSKKINKRLGW